MMVFDQRELERLADEARSTDAMCDYVGRYRRLLSRRVRRIVEALAVADLDDAMDAVLSLRASSVMVGACETAELAHQLKVVLRTGDLAGARSAASMLPMVTGRLDTLLGEFLAAPDCCSSGSFSRAVPCDSPPHAQCG